MHRNAADRVKKGSYAPKPTFIRQRFGVTKGGHVEYFPSPETDPAARRESYVRPAARDIAVLGRAPSAVCALMVRSCLRGQPPLDGLAALRSEVVRFRAAPRRRADLEGPGIREGLAGTGDGSSQRHPSPSALPLLDTGSEPERSGTIGTSVVPGPAEPPSGPMILANGSRSSTPVLPGTSPAALSVAADAPHAPDSPDVTVADLVARAQSGDADAFGLLYDRYLDLVYRYIYYRVGGVALAEDLTSETFLRALRRIDSFSWQGRDFAAWLVTIARNLIADHYKSGRYRLEITTEDILDAASPQTADSPENQVLEALTNRTLLEAVKQLNPEQQECIVLRFLQGLSVSETALVMDKNDGAIKALQYRAVRALARLLPADKLA
jgi:RNA polymerase sigma-70 factor, ECF subfamily